MPSDKKQYGSKQEGPALPSGDVKGKPVDYTRVASGQPSITEPGMRNKSGQA